ncbi:methyltransferase domain-containing protein [Streptomyces sp. NPDC057910]|uniref:methyltransferase domain-containing protein n=1 Tax=Streptomyces sp. NPDC057910 TaxID=3346278 RepID=UPI0036E5FE7F
MTDAHQDRPGRTELGRVLMSAGVLTSDWAPAFAAVPRAAFLPDLIWPFDMASGQSVPVARTREPELWHAYADADVPVVTQWDDGAHSGTHPGDVSTSSASMPSVVFSMLRDLDVRPGHRVLEIGTGTGWNAALLAHRLGDDRVVSVEVDAAVAGGAREALERFGAQPQVVCGDGYLGHPVSDVPYDRVIATCGLRSVPFAWVEQCRPGGLIVAPWGTHFTHGDAVARLVIAEDGRSASGRFTGPVEFMKLREQRRPAFAHGDYVPDGVGEGDETSTEISEGELLGGRFDPRVFALGLRVPDCALVVAEKREGARPVWFYGLGDRSWACVQFRDAGRARVWQAGPRRLWDEVRGALAWWEAAGRPGFDRFGLSVRGSGEVVWLDAPDRVVRSAPRP